MAEDVFLCFGNIKNVIVIADDIMVVGKQKKQIKS